MACGKNLKGKNIYENSHVYINNSFCPEFGLLNYLVRKGKVNGKIFRWKVRNGISYVQKDENDDFVEVSHKNDLVDLDLLDEE